MFEITRTLRLERRCFFFFSKKMSLLCTAQWDSMSDLRSVFAGLSAATQKKNRMHEHMSIKVTMKMRTRMLSFLLLSARVFNVTGNCRISQRLRATDHPCCSKTCPLCFSHASARHSSAVTVMQEVASAVLRRDGISLRQVKHRRWYFN